MKEIVSGVRVSESFCAAWESFQPLSVSMETAFLHIATLVREFRDTHTTLLDERASVQRKADAYFRGRKGKVTSPSEIVSALQSMGFIEPPKYGLARVETSGLPPEIADIQGPQLVVPADKANMVLNAMNARFLNLDEALLGSNLLKASAEDARVEEARNYRNRFLDEAVPLVGALWEQVVAVSFDKDARVLSFHTQDGKSVSLRDRDALVGVNFLENGVALSEVLLAHHRLHIELRLDAHKAIQDVWLESTLTFIIDLEDASLSAPESKYRSYAHIKKIVDRTLTCEVRGKERSIAQDTSYLDAETLQVKTLRRTALPLVRDVGGHLLADASMITVDGAAIPEKILDCYMTSLLGMRYHVVPKLHGEQEARYTVALFARINALLGLPEHANKIGIMNEEVRTNAQFFNSVAVAKDIVFFTNSGFLDYTGSFIDLTTQLGPIDSYRALAGKLYKTSYEENNVYVSLHLGVPQIGAGMWAKIRDMSGLLENKKMQVRCLNDTGWSPSPMASCIHAMAYHLAGDVKQLQAEYRVSPKTIPWESMFAFPGADVASLSPKDVEENLQYAIHGLLAYAEPWVRRGVGCSGVKELSGEPLMEDRATARIKTAFVRNWLLHGVTTVDAVIAILREMAMLVDQQNADKEGYEPIYTEALDDNVVRAVQDLLFNPDAYVHSYVEPYLYPAYVREQAKRSSVAKNLKARDFMGDWDAAVSRAV